MLTETKQGLLSWKTWNFIVAFSRIGKSSKNTTSPGKFWKSF